MLITDHNHEPDPNIMHLKCPHCEADRSSYGKPFTREGLQHHIRKRHPEGINQETKPDGVFTCEICGCWRSRRGIPFMKEEELDRHRSKAHGKPSAASRSNPTEGQVPTVQPKDKVRQRQAVISPVKFCPQCGCNVEVIAAALSFFP